MKKILVIVIVLVALFFGGRYLFVGIQESKVVISDPFNTTYLINEEPFTLVNGSFEKEIVPGSAIKDKVSVFGEPVFGDIDNDGDDDAVLILVNDQGGSGTFYYAAIAVNIDGEYKGTDTIFLGDRIAPQTFRIINSRAEVNYVERGPGEPFSVQPSFGKTIHLQFDPVSLRLIQVEVNFEGESDPNIMKLDMKTWKWVKSIYNSGIEIVPKNIDVFNLTFDNDKNTFSATTDCNSMGGAYEIKDNQITFKDVVSTLMFCEDSQEQEFSSMLGEIQFFSFTNKGELVFVLKSDSGSVIFK